MSPVTAEPGRPDRSSAPAAIASLRRAVADVLSGAAAAVVTSPVAKNVLYSWGFAEPGQTEFLATLAQEATGKRLRPVMMLWSPELAVVPVTIHLPLRQIFAHLSTELVVETGHIVARDLCGRFGIPRPAARYRRAQSSRWRRRHARRRGPRRRSAGRRAACR
jgi:4-hydroxythreonine-4-phosphate dehydrogenase